MDFPPLERQPRDSEYNRYASSRAEIVRRWLFLGSTYREMDRDILGIPDNKYKGFQSMSILHHIGLNRSHQGFFKNKSYEQAIESLKDNTDCGEVLSYIVSFTSVSSDLTAFGSSAPSTYPVDVGYVVDELLGMERDVLATVRKNQYLFRENVLNAYDNKCCITGISEPRLLRASHIKPWKDSDPREKMCV